jgi:hypothetical protein
VKQREKELDDIALQDPEAGRILSSDSYFFIPPAQERTIEHRGMMFRWYPDPDPIRLARHFGGIDQVWQYPLTEEQVSGLNCVTCIHLMTWLTSLITVPKQYY